MSQKFLYRFSEYYDEDGTVRLFLNCYKVLKVTPKGFRVQIQKPFLHTKAKERFVLTGTLKCFAHTTKEEAFSAFKTRKIYHRKHVRSLLALIDKTIEKIETDWNVEDLDSVSDSCY